MIKALVANAAIMITSIALVNAAFRWSEYRARKLYQQLLIGIGAGVLGCVLIFYAIPVGPDLIVDLRAIPILIIAFYGTRSSLAVSSLIICLSRMFVFGLSLISVIGGLSVIAVALLCVPLSKSRIKLQHKWALGIAGVSVASAVSLLILQAPAAEAWPVLAGYSIGHLVTGYAIYFYLKHIDQLNSAYDKLHADSKTDYLTGLLNFRQYDESLNTCFTAAVSHGQTLSILFIDIDNFKHVNDTYGHLAGDQILKTFSRQLVAACRSTDIVCRRGGEEFTVILPRCSMTQAYATAERIRRQTAAYTHKLPDGQMVRITVSIGIASYPKTSASPDDIIDHADSALYRAKHSGKNTVITA